jgi:hypothetical protein
MKIECFQVATTTSRSKNPCFYEMEEWKKNFMIPKFLNSNRFVGKLLIFFIFRKRVCLGVFDQNVAVLVETFFYVL